MELDFQESDRVETVFLKGIWVMVQLGNQINCVCSERYLKSILCYSQIGDY